MAALADGTVKFICDRFGLESLRPHQSVAISKVIVERSDILVLMPTGMGKSLCYEALTITNSDLK